MPALDPGLGATDAGLPGVLRALPGEATEAREAGEGTICPGDGLGNMLAGEGIGPELKDRIHQSEISYMLSE